MFGNFRGTLCLLILAGLSRVALSQGVTQAAGQPAATVGTGAITGVVKLGDAPAARITLALTPDRSGRVGPQAQPDQGITNQAVTDEKGQYRFANVASGRFRVSPLAEAFVVTGDGARPGAPSGI